MFWRAFWVALAACVALPAAAGAQPRVGVVTGAGPGVYGSGYWHSGFPYGPRVAPPWGYYGLGGGPFVGYPNFGSGYPFAFPYYPGALGSQWTNGLSLYGPPVPTYGPLPTVSGNRDLERAWRMHPGIAGYGWVGIYAASPRPHPRTVNVWPQVESFGTSGVIAPGAGVPAGTGGCLILSVKVPQPGAEVLVDGRKTTQTGTDRIFESPPLGGRQAYKYTVTARWIDRGQWVEVSREVSGTPGEVVRVDFDTPPVVATGK